MLHKLFASKSLTIEGRQIAAGAQVATVETDLPLDRLVAGLGNGAVTLTPPTAEVKASAVAPATGEAKPAKVK